MSKMQLDELASTKYKDLVPETEDDVEALSEFEHAFEMGILQSN